LKILIKPFVASSLIELNSISLTSSVEIMVNIIIQDRSAFALLPLSKSPIEQVSYFPTFPENRKPKFMSKRVRG